MCGIWLLISQTGVVGSDYMECDKVTPRGPDYTNIVKMDMKVNRSEKFHKDIDVKDYTTMMGFHRLSIMDPTINGRQPFKMLTHDGRSLYLVCNGEIYNYRELREMLEKEYGEKFHSKSDCEVILPLFKYFGFDETVKMISSSEFAFVILERDEKKNKYTIYAARDPFGVRPLYYGINQERGFLCISSELKGIPDKDVTVCKQFPPGHLAAWGYGIHRMHVPTEERPLGSYIPLSDPQHCDFIDKCIQDNNIATVPYYKIPSIEDHSYERSLEMVREALVQSVVSRLDSDRPLGALLSGGLDSSLICSIASRELKKHGKRLRTFSIGMEGGTDEYYAKKVAEFIDSDHTHYTVTMNDFVDAIPEVIKTIETFDTTTVRASTGQWFISKLILENTDVKVLLLGDGSDELCSGYMYFHNAPTPMDAVIENNRLLADIHMYDGQRADRSVSGHSLEARMPFLDRIFVDAYSKIKAEYRIPTLGERYEDYDKKDRMEKFLLRKAFEGYLPEECLWRRKEAFSDGVSSHEKSWYEIIQDNVEDVYNDEIFEKKRSEYTHYTPVSKEELYFRETFVEHFGKNEETAKNIAPYRWLPKWCGDVTEPSARILDTYQTSKPTTE